MPLIRTIQHHVGDDKAIPFVIFDRAGMTDDELEAAIAAGTAQVKDITGWTFRFSVRTSDKTSDARLIDKESGASPTEIEVLGTYDADPTVNTQKVWVYLFDTDTAAADGSSVVIPPKKYRFSLKRDDEGAEEVLVKGPFDLAEATER